jgi:hypothetical protein
VSGIKWVALFATVFCFGRISLRSCPSLCTIGHQMARTAVLAEQHCIPHVTLWRWDPIGCPETSVNNSQSAQLNIPEERGPLRHSLPQYEWRMASCWRLCGLMRQNSNDADKRRARVEGKGIQCRSVKYWILCYDCNMSVTTVKPWLYIRRDFCFCLLQITVTALHPAKLTYHF